MYLAFSFHATKVYNSIEGGAACFRDKEFGLDLYRLRILESEDRKKLMELVQMQK